ncbi:hypothetical protein KBC79_03030 [Candidatus Woesebacteria bacterium]|nr:hypothetical protein [Candidatus Woesebacteria bacterium]
MPEKKNTKQLNLKVFLATRQYFVATVGLGIFSVLLVLAAILPQLNASWTLFNQWQAEKPKLEKLKAKLVELQNVQFTAEYGQKQIVESALPSHKPLLELLSSLNNIAAVHQVTIDHFQINPGEIASDAASLAPNNKKKNTTGPNNVDSLDLELKVSGTFEDVTNFLVTVEKVAPFTSIRSMSFGDKDKDTEVLANRVLEATLQTRTYFFTQSVKATIEAPLPKLTAQDQQVLGELASFSTIELPDQTEVVGGVEDLFDADELQF